jgi:hypothetical protein
MTAEPPPPPHGSDWQPASVARRLLAVFLDFVLFDGVWVVGLWAARQTLPELQREPLLVKAVVFVLVEAALVVGARWTPGIALLGIRLPAARAFLESGSAPSSAPNLTAQGKLGGVERPPGGRAAGKTSQDLTESAPLPLVREALLERERWWTMLFGVLALLSGVQLAVRWTEGTPPTPWFGLRWSAAAAGLIAFAVGVVECLAGAAALRLRPAVLPLGAGVFGAAVVSSALAWEELPGWVGAYVAARRSTQGLPVDPGEIEVMARIMPPGFVIMPAVALGWTILVYLRTRGRVAL